MKISTSLILLLVLISTLSFIPPPAGLSLRAQDGEIPDGPVKTRELFGGKIQQVEVCTCPAAPPFAFLWMQVGPPVSKAIVLTPFSLQYLFYSYKVGSWTLGDALPVQTACYQYIGTGCYATKYGFPVIHIGTSLGSGNSEDNTGSADGTAF